MNIAKLEDMTRGWFVGNFTPSLLKTNDVEVAIQKYKKGDYEHATKWLIRYINQTTDKTSMNLYSAY